MRYPILVREYRSFTHMLCFMYTISGCRPHDMDQTFKHVHIPFDLAISHPRNLSCGDNSVSSTKIYVKVFIAMLARKMLDTLNTLTRVLVTLIWVYHVVEYLTNPILIPVWEVFGELSGKAGHKTSSRMLFIHIHLLRHARIRAQRDAGGGSLQF